VNWSALLETQYQDLDSDSFDIYTDSYINAVYGSANVTLSNVTKHSVHVQVNSNPLPSDMIIVNVQQLNVSQTDFTFDIPSVITGEEFIVDNPLIISDVQAGAILAWILPHIMRKNSATFTTRADVRLDPLDAVSAEFSGNLNRFDVANITYSYAGAYRGEISGTVGDPGIKIATLAFNPDSSQFSLDFQDSNSSNTKPTLNFNLQAIPSINTNENITWDYTGWRHDSNYSGDLITLTPSNNGKNLAVNISGRVGTGIHAKAGYYDTFALILTATTSLGLKFQYPVTINTLAILPDTISQILGRSTSTDAPEVEFEITAVPSNTSSVGVITWSFTETHRTSSADTIQVTPAGNGRSLTIKITGKANGYESGWFNTTALSLLATAYGGLKYNYTVGINNPVLPNNITFSPSTLTLKLQDPQRGDIAPVSEFTLTIVPSNPADIGTVSWSYSSTSVSGGGTDTIVLTPSNAGRTVAVKITGKTELVAVEKTENYTLLATHGVHWTKTLTLKVTAYSGKVFNYPVNIKNSFSGW
jgi:hypothetical protein